MNLSQSLMAAAVGGILLGAAGYGHAAPQQSPMPDDQTVSSQSDAPKDKHACKGKNECKGKGGCKTDKHACKGQNACKGQGGCKS